MVRRRGRQLGLQFPSALCSCASFARPGIPSGGLRFRLPARRRDARPLPARAARARERPAVSPGVPLLLPRRGCRRRRQAGRGGSLAGSGLSGSPLPAPLSSQRFPLLLSRVSATTLAFGCPSRALLSGAESGQDGLHKLRVASQQHGEGGRHTNLIS